MPVDEQFCQCVVRHAACVLAGIKPAALFNFIPRRPEECAGCTCERLCDAQARRQAGLQALGFTRRYGTRGVRCDVLTVGRGRALMLVSRTAGLARLIGQADVAAFLAQAGLDVAGPRQLVRSLRIKMTGFEECRTAQAMAEPDNNEGARPTNGTRTPHAVGGSHIGGDSGTDMREAPRCTRCPHACAEESPSFPHEVGVVLGYPLSDVRAFIAHDGKDELACGVWKAYSDPQGAQACWRAMRACRAQAMHRYRQGAALEELIA